MQKLGSSLIQSILFLLLMSSCSSSNQENTEKPVDPQAGSTTSYNYEIESVKRTAEDCMTSSCAEVVMNYPQFTNDLPGADQINDIIKKTMTTQLSDYIMEAEGGESLDALTKMFLKSYAEFKEAFPESKTAWYAKLDVMVSHLADEYISLSVSNSSYTGGAHPNATVTYLNLSKEGEKIDNWEYFFTSPAKVKDLVEARFRKTNDLTAEDSFSDKGFIFDNNEFALSSNFGFTKTGLVVYYNPYEIAAYAEGAAVVTLSFEELGDVYKY